MILAESAVEAAGEVVLTPAGGAMMALCVGLVLGLNVFCLTRILRSPRPSEHHHAPQETDTRDLDT